MWKPGKHRTLRYPRWLNVLAGGLIVLALLDGCASNGEQYDGDDIPPSIARIPDAVPKVEPKSKFGNPETYVVFGKSYRTRQSSNGYVARGTASWYGKDFQGKKTSSGERYNMYSMSAAHKTLPLPTYARITNLENHRSVVVRINDRGPFHDDRLIDLSYVAAVKLGIARKGTAKVEIRAIDPRHPGRQSSPGPFLADTSPSRTPQPATTPPKRVKTATPPAPDKPAAPQPTPAQTPLVAAVAATPPASGPSGSLTSSPHDRVERVARPAAISEPAPRIGVNSIYLQVGAFGNPDNAERLRERLTTHLQDPVLVENSTANGLSLYKVKIGPLASRNEANRVSGLLGGLGLGLGPPRVIEN